MIENRSKSFQYGFFESLILEKRKKRIRDEFLSAPTFEAVAREYIEQMMVKNRLAQPP